MENASGEKSGETTEPPVSQEKPPTDCGVVRGRGKEENSEFEALRKTIQLFQQSQNSSWARRKNEVESIYASGFRSQPKQNMQYNFS